MKFYGVISMALLSAGLLAQDPLVTLPQNYKVVFENADVKVIRAHYGPHEKVPVHDHPGVATVFVYLNDAGKVRIDHDGDGAESVVRPPTVKGSYRVAAALAERHSIENLGDQPSEFLRVELKRVTLTMKEPFRGKAPVTPGAGEVVEFETPGVRVERIVCVGSAACAVKAEAEPSVLVAFGATELTVGSGKSERLEDGGVRWLTGSAGATVVGPVQVLRVVVGK
jgi:hypothetical protein